MKWLLPEQDDVPLIDWLYKSRNIMDIDKFANPKFEQIHDPFLFYGMHDAVKAIKEYIDSNRKIFIHGDFDVDGISATSLLWQFLYREAKANIIPYIPNRFNEGYGLSEESINAIIDQGGELIITVDCGVKDIELVKKYSDKVKFIITDHHTILNYNNGDPVPEGAKVAGNYLISSSALSIVHPRLGDYPFHELCGASVSWKLSAALNQYLALNVDMTKYLDLAALGTVCDVMPLIDENRVIVKLGLEQMKKTENIGLKTMFEVLKIDPNLIDTYHLGFIIGPRLNASGRLESAMDAVRLLTTNNREFAFQLIEKLNNLNTNRQALTQEYIKYAEEQIANQSDNKLYFVFGEEWPEGIIGLIAGKLTEKYNRPVIAGSLKENRIKASARSIEAFNIAHNLSSISEHLLTHGGHALAAGLSFKYENKDKVIGSLLNLANVQINLENMEKTLRIDAILQCNDATTEIYKKIALLSPFGMGNHKPVLAMLDLDLKRFNTIGKENNHVKFYLSNGNSDIECIAFNLNDKFLEIFRSYSTPQKIDVAGTLDLNSWNGEDKVTMNVKDIRIKN
jgi:single-stranded-DNA-specific exonuclease